MYSTTIGPTGAGVNNTGDNYMGYYVMGATTITTVGIITNILNLIVLSLKTMKSTTNKYLWALAICDLFVLVLSLLTLSNSFSQPDFSETADKYLTSDLLDLNLSDDNMTEIEFPMEELTIPNEKRSNWPILSSLYTKWIVNVYPRIYPFIYPLAIMFQAGTVWISLVMSVDRFIAIHFPLKSLKFCTISNARKFIALVFILAFLYCSPRFLEFYARVETLRMFGGSGSGSGNQQTLTIVHTDLTRIGKSTKFRQLVYVWMYVIFQSVIPLLILTCINIALLFSLARSERTIPGGVGDSARSINRVAFARRDITFMIITVVLLFVILQTPSVVCNCVYGTSYRGSAFNPRSSGINTVCNIGNLFILTCSSQTFFIYFAFNKKFRKMFFGLITRLLCFWKDARSLYKKSAFRHYAPVVLRHTHRTTSRPTQQLSTSNQEEYTL